MSNKYALQKGDCLEVMQKIPNGSIDMILCDLPYGKVTHNKWDSIIPFDELWKEYKRVIKENGAIVLFGQNAFSAKLILSNERMYRYTLVWDKVRTTGFLNANRMPLRKHEDILVFYKKLPIYNPQMTEGGEPSHSRGKKWENKGNSMDNSKVYGSYDHKNYTKAQDSNMKYPTSIVTVSNIVNKDRLHPTQKPVELLEYLIKTYTNENDLVLDNCMGSGSTGVACLNTSRRFLGIEKEDDYFYIAKERINSSNIDIKAKGELVHE
ncbi:DNA-methyltransferase [Liquorilactobacillus mali]|uniref:Methyltransferase n=1 Tax=Liquorilactobacillus mali KCTC 3596 = DSM 20444 TaxID=1046596 RepID=A0A0R2EDH7_9LACO|nr:site-specific DNA-methyltransferase [Liquorilactobacillus mali]KRN10858.1 phage DNA methylase [Liquorilactobacillus mali KCTC 3596 = DSM 20444]